MPLLSKFKGTIQRYNLLNKNDALVVGVSGGPDSVCVLYLLKSIQKEFRFSLHVAHLNHMLRGKESQKDADFVLSLAKKLSFPVTIKALEAGGLSNQGSLEEAARKARLDFLFEIARKVKAKKIVLGHNLDDQAETVLMRIVRGSGLMGLSGILPKRSMGRVTIIRPLLEISRNEIERFLKKKKIAPRIDATNAVEVYFRNKIRHRLLPQLKTYNPNIKKVLANMAENVALDYEYLLSKASIVFEKLKVSNTKPLLTLKLEKLQKLHPALLNMVLRLAYEARKGDTRRLAYQHIKELKELLYQRPDGAIVDLPFLISVKKQLRYIYFYRRRLA